MMYTDKKIDDMNRRARAEIAEGSARDAAIPLAQWARERPDDLRRRWVEIERLALLTQQALDAYHRADNGTTFADRFSTLAPELQKLVGVVKP